MFQQQSRETKKQSWVMRVIAAITATSVTEQTSYPGKCERTHLLWTGVTTSRQKKSETGRQSPPPHCNPQFCCSGNEKKDKETPGYHGRLCSFCDEFARQFPNNPLSSNFRRTHWLYARGLISDSLGKIVGKRG